MKENILIINIAKERLHYFEFVKPICDILDSNNIKYFVRNYKEVSLKDLKKAKKAIICGTSLYDNVFIKNLDKFKWINDFNKPILGICGGMQMIGTIFGGKIKKQTEIGYYNEEFNKDFLGLLGQQEVYHLHNYYVDYSKLPEFEIFCGKEISNSHPDLVNLKKKISKSKCSQAVKHQEKEIYGVLFHPEVRQKELFLHFLLK